MIKNAYCHINPVILLELIYIYLDISLLLSVLNVYQKETHNPEIYSYTIFI